MPPKTVICNTCKESVLKSTTCHIGNNKRACKKHDGVKERNQILQQTENDKRKKALSGKHFTPQLKFFQKILIESKKIESETGKHFSITSAQENELRKIRASFKEHERRCIFMIKAKVIPPGFIDQINEIFRLLPDFTGYINICPECLQERGLDGLVDKHYLFLSSI